MGCARMRPPKDSVEDSLGDNLEDSVENSVENSGDSVEAGSGLCAQAS